MVQTLPVICERLGAVLFDLVEELIGALAHLLVVLEAFARIFELVTAQHILL